MKLLISILFLVLAASCTATKHGALQESQQEAHVKPVPPEWTEVKEFRWGHTVIRVGRTEKEVLDQIGKSGLPQYDNRWPLSKPTSDMVAKGIWVLSAGPGGPAPGFASVRLTFQGGKVVKVEKYTGPMPG